MLLYDELVSWYRLIDPPADHADEAASYRDAVLGACPTAQTLLDLGSGAGHNVVHLKQRFRCTMSDLSPAMLALSRELHPECEHFQSDMRKLRLERTFDAVLVHDAVMYMLTEDDLLAAARTAFVHTRPGGAAVFAPDAFADDFAESTVLLEHTEGDRAMRGIQWSFDPDPNDTTHLCDYVFALRDGTDVRVVHDRHVEGLFPRATWVRILESVGFRVSTFGRPRDDEGGFDQCFVCVR